MTSALPRLVSARLSFMALLQIFWDPFCLNSPQREEATAPIAVGPLPLSISGSDKYALRLKLTFKALEKLKILLGSYEH